MWSGLGSLIDELKEEHKVIRRMLAVLVSISGKSDQEPVPVGDLETIMGCLAFAVRVRHHDKEEEVLFPALARHGRLREGGPRCTFFFKYKMDGAYINDIMEVVAQRKETLKPPSHNENVLSFFKENSPLTIPLEEHDVGFYTVQLINQEIQKYKENPQSSTQLSRFVNLYAGLMDLHIRKEDECLFVMASEQLSAEIKNDLYEKALQLDQSSGLEKWEQCLADLEKLERIHL